MTTARLVCGWRVICDRNDGFVSSAAIEHLAEHDVSPADIEHVRAPIRWSIAQSEASFAMPRMFLWDVMGSTGH